VGLKNDRACGSVNIKKLMITINLIKRFTFDSILITGAL